ncbi:MAG: sensor histidine kinase, partial [Bradymonadaceae bacterium]
EMDRLIMIGTLAGGVVHEINDPLAFIRANLDVLRTQLADQDGTAVLTNLSETDVSEMIGDAIEGTRRIQRVIDDLKTLATREDTLALEPIDLEEVLESSIRMAGKQVQYSARLVREYSPLPSKALAHEAKLIQVLLNLLINAAQAIPDGTWEKNHIRLATRYVDGEAIIEVSDTGVGISSEALPHIFEPFYSTRSSGGGIGLGLSICHTIVQRLRGRLEVDSQPGVGTTVRVVLSLPHEPQLAEDTLESPGNRAPLIVDKSE